MTGLLIKKDDLIIEVIAAIVFLVAALVFLCLYFAMPDKQWLCNASGLFLGTVLARLAILIIQVARTKEIEVVEAPEEDKKE